MLSVDRLREKLFNQEFDGFMESAIEVLQQMSEKNVSLTDEERSYYYARVKELSFYLNCGDYLLVSDLLKYELSPLFAKKEH